jgi:isoleucyl-tRNA synthetase
VLGPRFGKDMKLIANKINSLSAEDISKIERDGQLDVEINGKMTTLESGDVVITSQDIEGWLVASNAGMTVALDVVISQALKKEGVARELVNRIQNLRKDAGFEVTDRIDVTIQKDAQLDQAVLDNMTYIKNETLTEHLNLIDNIADGVEIVFDTIETKLAIKKH